MRRAPDPAKPKPKPQAADRDLPEKKASDRDLPERQASDPTKPVRQASDRDLPEQKASDRDPPERQASDRDLPERQAADRDPIDQEASDEDRRKRRVSDRDLPERRPPDLAVGRAFLRKQAPPGRVLLCAVSGSHFYGFPAPDSDLDLKGIYAAPLPEVLGLFPARDSVDIIAVEQGLECDLTLNELQLAVKLLLKGNGNLLERLFSPFQLIDTPEMAELRELSPSFVSQQVIHHYRGFLKNVYHLHQKEAQRTLKRMLYAYRIALTAGHLLLTGEVIGDLGRLAPEHGFAEILPFIGRYCAGSEQDRLSAEEDEMLLSRRPDLEQFLEEALDRSCLPPEPREPEKLSAWLVAVRLAER